MTLPKNSRLIPIFKIQDEYFLRLHFFDTGVNYKFIKRKNIRGTLKSPLRRLKVCNNIL